MPSAQNQGINIYYQVEGEGSPLLMLGGFPGSVEDMHDFEYVSKLKEDYKLILIDYRGFGKSDKPHDTDQYSIKLIVEDIVAVLKELAIKKCHVYGHSMGGWIIYGLAKYYPNILLSMIISDGVPGSGDPEGIREVLGAFDEFINSIDSLTALQKERWLSNDLKALNAISDWVVKDNQLIINLVDSVISEINIPCLVLMSNLPEESDEYILLKKTVDLIPNAEFAHFNELSHFELFFRSDLVLPKIKKFLAKASSK
ncbi:MAG: alpha/beta hydrolase [Chloroflexi bacterium]|nr:alpha/beta hydrolase [Chloroflexota bacterium]